MEVLAALLTRRSCRDPERNGAEQFLDEPGVGYEHACGAAPARKELATKVKFLE